MSDNSGGKERLRAADRAFARKFIERPFWPFQIEGEPSRKAFTAAQELDAYLSEEFPGFYRGLGVFGSQITGYASEQPRRKNKKPSDVDFMLSYERLMDAGLNLHQFLTSAEDKCAELSRKYGIKVIIGREAEIQPIPSGTGVPRLSYIAFLANMCLWSTQGGEEGMITHIRNSHREYFAHLPSEVRLKIARKVTELLFRRERGSHPKRMQRSRALQDEYKKDREGNVVRVDYQRWQVWRKRVRDIFAI